MQININVDHAKLSSVELWHFWVAFRTISVYFYLDIYPFTGGTKLLPNKVIDFITEFTIYPKKTLQSLLVAWILSLLLQIMANSYHVHKYSFGEEQRCVEFFEAAMLCATLGSDLPPEIDEEESGVIT